MKHWKHFDSELLCVKKLFLALVKIKKALNELNAPPRSVNNVTLALMMYGML